VGKIGFEMQPRIRLLSDDDIRRIHESALSILEETGVLWRSDLALEILEGAGAMVDFDKKVSRFPPELVLDAVSACPSEIQMFSTRGEPAALLKGDNVHFAPGSTALKFGSGEGREVREARAADLEGIVRLVDALPNLAFQSTAVVVSDTPREIGDLYRLYVVLKNSAKPVVTGAFSVEGLTDMKDMLAAVVGGDAELAARPVAIFDVCPSPPLMWTEISARNIIDCARYGLPVEFISMPMSGANAPATISGSILQHTVETLSGIVLAQAVRKGTPVVYGGAPSFFEMRFGTAPFGSVETMTIDIGYAQMGKFYGLPTHTYTATTDSKVLDVQAGLETGIGAILGALAGINVISGPGMFDFLTCQSLEKLVIDNEVCGMVGRFLKGVDASDDALAEGLIRSLGPGGEYLSTEHTMRFFRKEMYVPGQCIDRRDRKNWELKGATDVIAKARESVARTLGSRRPAPLPEERSNALDEVMRSIVARYNIESLPLGPTV